MSRSKLIKITIAIVILCLLVSLVWFVIRIAPYNMGNYTMEHYTIYFDKNFHPEYKQYDEIQDYKDAYNIALDVIDDVCPTSDFTRFNTWYKREVYYDSQSDTWFVHAFPWDNDFLDGEYGVIISTDGTVVGCFFY